MRRVVAFHSSRLWRASEFHVFVFLSRLGQPNFPSLQGVSNSVVNWQMIKYWLVHRPATKSYFYNRDALKFASTTSRRCKICVASQKGLSNAIFHLLSFLISFLGEDCPMLGNAECNAVLNAMWKQFTWSAESNLEPAHLDLKPTIPSQSTIQYPQTAPEGGSPMIITDSS